MEPPHTGEDSPVVDLGSLPLQQRDDAVPVNVVNERRRRTSVPPTASTAGAGRGHLGLIVGALTLAVGLAAYYVAGALTAPGEAPVSAPAGSAASPAPVASVTSETPAINDTTDADEAVSPVPAPGAPEPPRPASPETEATGSRAVPVPQAVGPGSLLVESRPAGAVVYLNNRRVGQTPLSLSDLPAGQGVVRIERDGYRRWASPVEILAGRTVRVTASLEGVGAR